jgi:hypothetical protein
MGTKFAPDQKIILCTIAGVIAFALIALALLGGFEKRLTEERVKELARPYVEMAVARKVEELKPKVNAIADAMIYNDFVSAESLTWELSSYLDSEEQ